MLVFQTLAANIGTVFGTILAQAGEMAGVPKTLKALLTKGCGRGEIGKHKGLKRLITECRPAAASLNPSYKTITCLTLNPMRLGFISTTVPMSCQNQSNQ